MFPQVVFGVVNLESDSTGLSSGSFANLREEREKTSVKYVRQAIEHLAAGNRPTTELQQHIASAMSVLGGGTEKYQRVLDEDLRGDWRYCLLPRLW